MSVWLIDSAGRRPLLIDGGSVAALAVVLLTVADYLVKPMSGYNMHSKQKRPNLCC